MKKPIAVGLYLLLGIPFLWGQSTSTTTFTQVTHPCSVTGCTNAQLSDGETFSFTDTLQYYGVYPILGTLQFRGVKYAMSGQASGYETIDLSNSQGFAVHEAFSVRCYRGCSQTWLNGSLTVPNTYLGVQVDTSVLMYTNTFGQVVQQYPDWPSTAFGGSVYRATGNIEGPTTGIVQVGLVTASDVDTPVILTCSDAAFTIPSEITIPAGSTYQNAPISAAVIPYNQPAVTATIRATFPDGSTAIITVTDSQGPTQLTGE
jgi:hypothetical protein